MRDVKSRSTVMAEEAILLCGCDFRLHGRDWSTGLDCIGLTGLCLSAAGDECTIPSGYSIRSGDIDSIGLIMEQAGFEKISHDDHPGEGDVLLEMYKTSLANWITSRAAGNSDNGLK